jgi:hypothetical protein
MACTYPERWVRSSTLQGGGVKSGLGSGSPARCPANPSWLLGDRVRGRRADLGQYLVDLDGMDHAVDKVDQRPDTYEQEAEPDGDGKPAVLPSRPSARDADRVQTGRVVGERCDEQAKHHLSRPVPQEVAQQPGRIPVGRHL